MKHLFYLLAVIVIASSISACNTPATQKEIVKTNSVTAIHNHGINIAFTDTGKSDTTLLFIHGWAINKGYWADQLSYFGKKYRFVAIDLPGFGQSGKDRSKWDTKTYSNDIDSVIKELKLKQVILIGHSMSGDIALQAAIENPTQVIGLIGVDNFKNAGEPQNPEAKKQLAAALQAMKHNFKKIAYQYINESLFSKNTPAAIKKRVLNDVAHADTTIAVASMEQQDPDFDEIAKLKQYGKKLYLISSDVTPTVTKYLSAQNIPFKIYYTKGTGHYAMVETPQQFNALLDEAIADIRKHR